MGRPLDPQAPYRVSLHVSNGYTYASTQPSFIDPKSGKRTHRVIHWVTVDEALTFHPGNKFFTADPEERAKLNFPADWDLSEAERFTGLRHPGRPPYCGACQNRLYGHVWLLEQVALRTGVKQDLDVVFNGNSELVDDILTLAMFPYLTGHTYNRTADWQAVCKAPSSRDLTPSVITRLTQFITERHRMKLFELRAARVGKDDCAPSTPRAGQPTGTALQTYSGARTKRVYLWRRPRRSSCTTFPTICRSTIERSPETYRTHGPWTSCSPTLTTPVSRG